MAVAQGSPGRRPDPGHKVTPLFPVPQPCPQGLAQSLQRPAEMNAPESLPTPPSRAARAGLGLLARLPQGALSRAFGGLADLPIPRVLRRPVLGAFARLVGADPAEAEYPFEHYGSLNRFFTRKLREGVRRWPREESVLASPVDGTTGQLGQVQDGWGVQAKGRRYSVAALLDAPREAERFEGGAFLTLYLSPRDYHRIHAPLSGAIHAARYVPGALLPVNLPAVSHVPDLFPRNERLVCYVDGAYGRAAIVAVGAFNVGRISAAFDPLWNAPGDEPSWVTNRRGAEPLTRRYAPPVRIQQGDEIMTFHLGSTVVLLFEPGRVELDTRLRPEQRLLLGEALGRLC